MSPLSAASTATVNQASNAEVGTVQGVAAFTMLRRSMDMQAQAAAQLIQALPQPAALATSGALGTQVNTYA